MTNHGDTATVSSQLRLQLNNNDTSTYGTAGQFQRCPNTLPPMSGGNQFSGRGILESVNNTYDPNFILWQKVYLHCCRRASGGFLLENRKKSTLAVPGSTPARRPTGTLGKNKPEQATQHDNEHESLMVTGNSGQMRFVKTTSTTWSPRRHLHKVKACSFFLSLYNLVLL